MERVLPARWVRYSLKILLLQTFIQRSRGVNLVFVGTIPPPHLVPEVNAMGSTFNFPSHSESSSDIVPDEILPVPPVDWIEDCIRLNEPVQAEL